MLANIVLDMISKFTFHSSRSDASRSMPSSLTSQYRMPFNQKPGFMIYLPTKLGHHSFLNRV
jgi:hypothetical protein